MIIDFGCNLGDTLYVITEKTKSVCRFRIDSLKICKSGCMAHGLLIANRYSCYTDFNLKKLDKRIIFTSRKSAEEWRKSRKNQKNKTV